MITLTVELFLKKDIEPLAILLKNLVFSTLELGLILEGRIEEE